MPHISEMKGPSKYVSAPDLEGKDQVVRITKVTSETMNDGTNKWIIYFRSRVPFEGDQKGVALNQTNIHRIAALHGDHTDEWIGKVVTLTTEWTQDRQGKPIKGVRIKMPDTNSSQVENKSRYDTPKQAPVISDDGELEVPF